MGLIPLLLRSLRARRYFNHLKKIELDNRKAIQAKKAQREKEKQSIDSIDLPDYKPALDLKSLLRPDAKDLLGS